MRIQHKKLRWCRNFNPSWPVMRTPELKAPRQSSCADSNGRKFLQPNSRIQTRDLWFTTTTCVEHSLISFNCICILLICILYNIWFSILITRVQKAAGGMNRYYGPRPRKVSSAILPHLDFKISESFFIQNFFTEVLYTKHQMISSL